MAPKGSKLSTAETSAQLIGPLIELIQIVCKKCVKCQMSTTQCHHQYEPCHAAGVKFNFQGKFVNEFCYEFLLSSSVLHVA